MQAALANDLPWSPSTVFSVECTLPNHNVRDIVDVTAMGKEVKQLLATFFCIQGQYIKITICKRPLTLIEAKLMGFASY